MKTRNWLIVIAVLLTSCVPIEPPVVEPPEPPVLTMRQRQKVLMDRYKRTGLPMTSGFVFVATDPNQPVPSEESDA